ncbi:MAG: hypothetical protein AUK63_667 [bacterium P3]|nr:MAG: hypothetical protein AUK63_667 [bacterium P3]KWW42150.1 MAG: hypothetical protein F083_489 [bacterium F083]
MTDEQFEQLWQQAKVDGLVRELAEGYSGWLRRRRRVRNMAVAAVILLTAVSVPALFMPDGRNNKNYEHVFCNRAGANDEQWVQLAADMLLEDA